MGFSPFARRYSGNRFFFLFLRLLRCFSSPGSPPWAMDSPMGAGGFLRRVSPFRHPRILAYLQLPAAFRSLSRLSSAPSAKASALCPFLLNLPFSRLAWRYSGGSRVSPGISFPSAWLPRHRASLVSFADLFFLLVVCQYSVFKVQPGTPSGSPGRLCASRHNAGIMSLRSGRWPSQRAPAPASHGGFLSVLFFFLFLAPAAACSPMPSPA